MRVKKSTAVSPCSRAACPDDAFVPPKGACNSVPVVGALILSTPT